MNKEIVFVKESWEDYIEWAARDKKIFKKINDLIQSTIRNPFDGVGKPEPLKNGLSGYWSRRITDEYRLIYRVSNDKICIIACQGHYPKKLNK